MAYVAGGGKPFFWISTTQLRLVYLIIYLTSCMSTLFSSEYFCSLLYSYIYSRQAKRYKFAGCCHIDMHGPSSQMKGGRVSSLYLDFYTHRKIAWTNQIAVMHQSDCSSPSPSCSKLSSAVRCRTLF